MTLGGLQSSLADFSASSLDEAGWTREIFRSLDLLRFLGL